MNVLPGEITARPDFVPQQRLGIAPAQRVMAFTMVENVANRKLCQESQEGGHRGQGTLRVEPRSLVTVMLHAGASGTLAAMQVVDATDFNRAHVRPASYSAMPDCPAAAVSINPAGPAVFGGTPSFDSRTRSVNLVASEIRGSSGERASASFALKGLEAGGEYSVRLISGAPVHSAFLTRDTTATYRP